MEGRDPLPQRQAYRRLLPWQIIVLVAAIVLAGIVVYRALPSTRSEEWVLTELATDGYIGSLSADLPISAFGSSAFRGPFVVEVKTGGGPIDVWLNVNGELVFQARAYEVAYAYPFETDGGKPLSTDLLLSLPPSAPATTVSIGFSTPRGSSAPTFRSASLSPSVVPEGLFVGPLRAAFSAARHFDPATTLGVVSYTFPPDATHCYGFASFTSRGYAWANLTVSDGVRYYYEIRFEGGPPNYLVMGHVEGGTMNHLHWTSAEFDLQAIVCKPSTSTGFEVVVEGPL